MRITAMPYIVSFGLIVILAACGVEGQSWEEPKTSKADKFPDTRTVTDTMPDPPNCIEAIQECTLGEIGTLSNFWVGAAVHVDGNNTALAFEHFNSITPESALKWGELARRVGKYDFSKADAVVEQARTKGLRVRGHTLLWGKLPGHSHPADLEEVVFAAADPRAKMKELMSKHITLTMGRYAGKIECWDVVNEPFANLTSNFDDNVFYKSMGIDYVAEAFHMARHADPTARLFINEFVLKYEGDKAAKFYELVKKLVDEGVPLDGVGIQTHVFFTHPDQKAFQGYLQSFADLGLAVELTEIDIAKTAMGLQLLTGEDMFDVQARVYEMLVLSCLEVKSCTGVTFWGVDDNRSWLDEQSPFDLLAPNKPNLLDTAGQPKPAYFAVREALFSRLP